MIPKFSDISPLQVRNFMYLCFNGHLPTSLQNLFVMNAEVYDHNTHNKQIDMILTWSLAGLPLIPYFPNFNYFFNLSLIFPTYSTWGGGGCPGGPDLLFWGGGGVDPLFAIGHPTRVSASMQKQS